MSEADRQQKLNELESRRNKLDQWYRELDAFNNGTSKFSELHIRREISTEENIIADIEAELGASTATQENSNRRRANEIQAEILKIDQTIRLIKKDIKQVESDLEWAESYIPYFNKPDPGYLRSILSSLNADLAYYQSVRQRLVNELNRLGEEATNGSTQAPTEQEILDAYLRGIGKGIGLDGINSAIEFGVGVQNAVINYDETYSSAGEFIYNAADFIYNNAGSVVDVAQLQSELSWQMAHNYDGVMAILLNGDTSDSEGMSEDLKSALLSAHEAYTSILNDIEEYLEGLDELEKAELKGRIIGNIVMAVLEALASGGVAAAGKAAKSGKFLNKIDDYLPQGTLKNKPIMADGSSPSISGNKTPDGIETDGKTAQGAFDEAKTNGLPIFNQLPSCFVAGTPILTPAGSIPIEQIQIGDIVWSKNEYHPNGDLLPRKVEKTFVLTAPVMLVCAGGQTIKTTPEHPFYVDEKGWVPVKDLIEGDLLVSHDGSVTPISAVINSGELNTVYNFRVAEDHTYFVGDEFWGFSVWVHNTYSIQPIPGDIVNGQQVYGIWDDTLNGGQGGWVLNSNTNKPVRSTSQQNLGNVADNANKLSNLPANPTFNSNFPSKVRHKLSWLGGAVRKAKDGGIDDAKALAEAAYRSGNGRVGAPVGQGHSYAVYFEDGPVTWVFLPNGEFISMRKN
ncbi:polymorphic toxin-type HINT domain-containing protein [Rubinisphaera italica]|uniref:Hint domain-containing protein n=1 Tax=Rubinisphaera italica TaxID=2527969 RepID=A0A5C5XAQ6_9PLAN|nr:polymorphic toxin-type HINT domain-containing protein [Rubinisphaera italica]TWT59739.1 hypothetical protein Pan54_04490 [Rubinisphaera italica]